MNHIMMLLPLPFDIVNIIISYNITRISKTDSRYALLLTIPKNKKSVLLFA